MARKGLFGTQFADNFQRDYKNYRVNFKTTIDVYLDPTITDCTCNSAFPELGSSGLDCTACENGKVIVDRVRKVDAVVIASPRSRGAYADKPSGDFHFENILLQCELIDCLDDKSYPDGPTVFESGNKKVKIRGTKYKIISVKRSGNFSTNQFWVKVEVARIED